MTVKLLSGYQCENESKRVKKIHSRLGFKLDGLLSTFCQL